MNAPAADITAEPLLTGHIKWFDGRKGFGFIVPDDGGKDVFLFITTVQLCGNPGLPNGIKVRYRAEMRPKGMVATFVEVVR